MGYFKKNQQFLKIFSMLFFVYTFFYSNVYAQPLTILTSIDPPLIYYNEDGKLTGATFDLLQEVAHRLKREISIFPVPWKRALYLVEKGEKDAICCAGVSEERLKYLYFPSINISSEQNVFFIKKGKKIKIDENLKNFSNIRIGVIRGYIYDRIQNALDNNKFKSIQKLPTIEQNIKVLIAERTDVFIGNKIVVLHILKKMGLYDKVEIFKKPGTNEDWIITDWPVYLAFSKKMLKDPSYMKKISQIIKDIKEDGTYKTILSKYK